MRRFALIVLTGGCAALAPPRAVVAVHVPAGPSHDTLLAMPTTCITVGPTHTDLGEDGLCGYATSQREGQPARHTIDELVDPTVRLKLELAGYMLADARTLRLETAERIDEGTDGETSTRVDETETVASLSPADRIAAAASIGLSGILDSTLQASYDGDGLGAPLRFTLVLALRSVPAGTPLWTTTCSEIVDDPDATLRLLASCVGDGVLAWRAPGAVIGQQR